MGGRTKRIIIKSAKVMMGCVSFIIYLFIFKFGHSLSILASSCWIGAHDDTMPTFVKAR
jgi:hypothetical protein